VEAVDRGPRAQICRRWGCFGGPPWVAGRLGRDGPGRLLQVRGGGVPQRKDGGATVPLLVVEALVPASRERWLAGKRCRPAVRGSQSGGSDFKVVVMTCP
jgi:hypothetical protein